MTNCRVSDCFQKAKAENRAALITFITAGDPDGATSDKILHALPAAGADLIEIGMAFSDPPADGPAVQAASLRALKAGQTVKKTLESVRKFRVDHQTPVILMGYFNPIYIYGVADFIADAKSAGVDGFIIADLPYEEDREFHDAVNQAGLIFIRIVTPTTSAERAKKILQDARGFVYVTAVSGVTGAKSAEGFAVKKLIDRFRPVTDLPLAVGFGVKNPESAAEIAQAGADGVIVGSAITQIAGEIGKGEKNVTDAVRFVEELKKSLFLKRNA